MEQFDATRRTFWTSTIAALAFPAILTALWCYWFSTNLPIPTDGPPSDAFVEGVVNLLPLSLILLWAGIKVWAISQGELTIYVGEDWIRLPGFGKVETRDIESVQPHQSSGETSVKVIMKKKSRIAGKEATISPHEYQRGHELVCLLLQFQGTNTLSGGLDGDNCSET